ncbi:DNA/RNA polymerase [Pluteus cervinus]|uniref:DNA/RNA polymerase n=1 Tax=Pluteus cervinus TaxID=181527 RepID=A0ACD3ARX5_9AGAR|nr:DNA/RNA polymerase [Pluteus cervinus]
MIPRAANRLETTLLLSRKSLPRPARLYSTPSKRANAPAFATAQVPRPDFLPYLSQQAQTQRPSPRWDNVPPSEFAKQLESFLNRATPYTILPPPLPTDRSSEVNDFWYTDSTTQDHLAVMDACLHNLYDVPRAQSIFERLREKVGNPVLSTTVYNAFLEAYLKMAATKESTARAFWVGLAWDLYEVMESGKEKVFPNAGTYATMLLAWHRFNVDSLTPVNAPNAVSPTNLLANLVEREITVSRVIADRVFTSSEEVAHIIKAISKGAVALNLSNVVTELGQAEAIGTHTTDVLDGVPEVRPVLRPKRGENSDAEESTDAQNEMPFNLENLRRHLAQVTLARRVLPDDMSARQKLLEESVYDVAVERLKHETESLAKVGLDSQAPFMQANLKRWMWDWHTKLRTRLEQEVKNIVAAEERSPPKHHAALGPYLSLVNSEKLSLITILEVMKLQGSGGMYDGMKTARALITVGKAVEVEYKAQICRRNDIQIPSSPARAPGGGSVDIGFFSALGYRNLQQRRVAAARHMTDGESWTAAWSQPVRSKIGGILVDCLMDVASVVRTAVDKNTGGTISEVQPAFYHSYEYIRGQKLGVIRLNAVVAERIAKDGLRETLHPRHLPMLVKPKPWLSYDQGGYLYNKNVAMRFKDSMEQLSYLKQASAAGNVELVYAGLDVLGSTPWKVNRRVFDVVLQVWNSGERLGKLPPAVYDLPEPERPQNWETDLKARSVFLQRQKAFNQGKANNHSDRCNVNYKIEIARAFLGDTFYLPHNLDFRGRAYPIPPHLNHIGDDLSRGLLTFAEAKPLGERGLRWLKIHLSNLYGFDKASFDERVDFVEQRLDDIFDSATKPLDGERWWTKADDPWQCLATCMELHAALTSPDPLAYLSSLPVHQDGTCNGLQHYAALGGDESGAAQVNLAAGERPSDVYTYVGNMVEKRIAEDVKKGDKYAKLLQGKITRKVVKQTVMTTVYGVTFVGARDQIERQLKDRKDLPEEDCWSAAAYLAKQTLNCIGDLFSGATAIQTWLNICARLISKSIPEERLPDAMSPLRQRPGTKAARKSGLLVNRLKKEQMTSVVWTTPLGLPIVQPYRKISRKQIMTNVQSVFISDPNSPAEVNSAKQASAFPPNFIHSLDATHMMLTALECRTQDLMFASVHDSYWTHASSIDKMSEVIRDTFIALHSSDVLGKLQSEFVERYKDHKIPLVSLQHGQLTKLLRAAGSQIVCTPEQAAQLDAINELLAVQDGTTPSELGTAETEITTAKSDVETISSEQEECEEEDEDAWEDGEDATPRQKATKARKVKAEQAAVSLNGKFVNLTDIIPPLPKKGTFRVQSIKKSQYFFS